MSIFEKKETANILTMIGLVFAFLALIPQLIPLFVKTQKQLFIGDQYTIPLIDNDSLIKEFTKIKVKDQDIDNIYITTIYFENIGKNTIYQTDFSDDVILNATNADFFEVEIPEIYQNKYQLSYTLNENKLIIKPFLFKNEDYFYLKLYSFKENNPLTVSFRLLDGDIVSKRNINKFNWTLFLITLLVQIAMIRFEITALFNKNKVFIISKVYSRIILGILFIAKYGIGYVCAILSVGYDNSFLLWSSIMIFINMIGLIMNFVEVFSKKVKIHIESEI